MQTVYKFVFGKLYRITKNVSETVRSRCVFVCCLILCWGFFADISGRGMMIERDMIIGSVLVLIVSALSIDSEPLDIRWNKWIYLSMTAFGTGMLLIGQLHYVGVGYNIYALDLMLVFPAFYYVQVSTGSSKRVTRDLAYAILISGIISCAYCWFLAARGRLPELLQGRFFGYFDNPNSLGMAGAVVLIAGLYLIIESDNKWIRAAAAAAVGIGTNYAFMSASRSAVLCEIICFISFLVFIVKRHRSGAESATDTKSIVICIVIAAVVMVAGSKIETLNLWAKQQNRDSSAVSSIVLTVEAATEGEQFQDVLVTTSAGSDEVAVTDRPGISDGLHDFTSGRIDIWEVYISHFNWTGMDVRELANWFGEGTAYRAHNNFIDYTVRCGYIVGFLYLIFYIAVGIKGLIILFSKKHIRPEDFLLVSVIGAYSIQALVEVATLPFTRIIPCMFFLTIAPLMGRSEDEEAGKTLEK